MMKRVFVYLSMLLTVLIMVSGCGHVVVQNETARRSSSGDSWTIMMYMCGSTLEEAEDGASNVLRSLNCDLPENINVVIETGGSRSWHTDDIYPDYIQDFVVQSNGIRMINQQSSVSMGEKDTLCSFMQRASKAYPAKHYMTIIWDHGGGPVGGTAYDSRYEFDSLSLQELKGALIDAGLMQDIIGFDASLTSNIETAEAVSLYAAYMVASEDVMPMSGWDYKSLFTFLAENPSAETVDVCKKICDDAAARAGDENETFLSMAVTDLSKQTMLSLAVDGAAQAMSACDADINAKQKLENLLTRPEHLGGNSRWEGYSNMVDARQFASFTRTLVASPSDNLMSAVDEAVVYTRMGKYHEGLGGIGVYLPSDRSAANTAQYAGVATSSGYAEFIDRSFTDNYSDSPAHVSYNALMADNTFTAASDLNGNFVLSAAHPEVIKNVGVSYYIYNKTDQKYFYIYTDYDVTYKPANGTYQYTVKGRIPQANGKNVSMRLVSRSVGYSMYSIPVTVGGELCNIRVSKSDAGAYNVIGLWKGIGKFTWMAERSINKLKIGDVVTPVYEVYGEENRYIEGRDIRIGLTGKLKVEDKRPADGTYVVVYDIEDIYGNMHKSNVATLTSTKGTFRFSSN